VIPQAVILLGGRGTRIAAQFPDRPKCLVPVGGKPFLERQLDWLRANGIANVLLAAGHMAGVLEDWIARRPPDALRITLSREPEPLGTGGALRFVEPQLASDPVLVLNGDSLAPSLGFSTPWKMFGGVFHAMENFSDIFPRYGRFSEEFSTLWKKVFHAVENPDGFFHAVENFFPRCGKLFVAPIEEAGRYGTVEFDADGFVTAFREKADRAGGFVNAGIYLLPRDMIAAVPAGQPVSLETEIFPALAAERRLAVRPCPPPLLDMGTPEGLAAMETFLLNRTGSI
jgi:NDP-sugar pyrophosphorylase family protein